MKTEFDPTRNRRVVSAAMISPDGLIIASPRHWDSICYALVNKLPTRYPGSNWRQGFVDQYGQFMSREEAWIVASAANQIRNPNATHREGVLFSENLY